MTDGIIARFRTMAIARPSVLTGHVLGSLLADHGQPGRSSSASRCCSASGPSAGPLDWLAAFALLVAGDPFALTWLAVAIGLAAKTRRDGEQHPDAR